MKESSRNIALTIILGVFISVMVITLINLIISYAYESPEYNDFCNESVYGEPYYYYDKPYVAPVNCSYNKTLESEANQCGISGGIPVYQKDDVGCSFALKECSYCQKYYDQANTQYNRSVFFIFAIVGFVLIVFGLFVKPLLLQIIALPSGAILVIESAIRNFDDKLPVIIVLTLLVVAAIYLALKKLKLT